MSERAHASGMFSGSESSIRIRLGLLLGVGVLATLVFVFQDVVPARLRSAIGVVCFLSVAIACSANPQRIRWQTVAWGLGLQLSLAILILRVDIGGIRPGYELFSLLAAVVTRFLEFTNVGSEFVFGVLANEQVMSEVCPNGLVLAFAALPIIIFVSSVFTVLYHLGVMQYFVGAMAALMSVAEKPPSNARDASRETSAGRLPS